MIPSELAASEPIPRDPSPLVSASVSAGDDRGRDESRGGGHQPAAPAALRRVRLRHRRERRRVELRILVEDRALKAFERLARLEAELLGQLPPGILVGAQGFRLPAASIEGEHQLAAQPLAERMRDDERFQLRDDGAVPAECELGVEPLLERAQPEFVEAGDLGLGEVVVGEVGEGLAAPELECLPDRGLRAGRISAGEPFSSLLQQRSEAIRGRAHAARDEEEAVPARLQALPLAERPATREICAGRS